MMWNISQAIGNLINPNPQPVSDPNALPVAEMSAIAHKVNVASEVIEDPIIKQLELYIAFHYTKRSASDLVRGVEQVLTTLGYCLLPIDDYHFLALRSYAGLLNSSSQPQTQSVARIGCGGAPPVLFGSASRLPEMEVVEVEFVISEQRISLYTRVVKGRVGHHVPVMGALAQTFDNLHSLQPTFIRLLPERQKLNLDAYFTRDSSHQVAQNNGSVATVMGTHNHAKKTIHAAVQAWSASLTFEDMRSQVQSSLTHYTDIIKQSTTAYVDTDTSAPGADLQVRASTVLEIASDELGSLHQTASLDRQLDSVNNIKFLLKASCEPKGESTFDAVSALMHVRSADLCSSVTEALDDALSLAAGTIVYPSLVNVNKEAKDKKVQNMDEDAELNKIQVLSLFRQKLLRRSHLTDKFVKPMAKLRFCLNLTKSGDELDSLKIVQDDQFVPSDATSYGLSNEVNNCSDHCIGNSFTSSKEEILTEASNDKTNNISQQPSTIRFVNASNETTLPNQPSLQNLTLPILYAKIERENNSHGNNNSNNENNNSNHDAIGQGSDLDLDLLKRQLSFIVNASLSVRERVNAGARLRFMARADGTAYARVVDVLLNRNYSIGRQIHQFVVLFNAAFGNPHYSLPHTPRKRYERDSYNVVNPITVFFQQARLLSRQIFEAVTQQNGGLMEFDDDGGVRALKKWLNACTADQLHNNNNNDKYNANNNSNNNIHSTNLMRNSKSSSMDGKGHNDEVSRYLSEFNSFVPTPSWPMKEINALNVNQTNPVGANDFNTNEEVDMRSRQVGMATAQNISLAVACERSVEKCLWRILYPLPLALYVERHAEQDQNLHQKLTQVRIDIPLWAAYFSLGGRRKFLFPENTELDRDEDYQYLTQLSKSASVNDQSQCSQQDPFDKHGSISKYFWNLLKAKCSPNLNLNSKSLHVNDLTEEPILSVLRQIRRSNQFAITSQTHFEKLKVVANQLRRLDAINSYTPSEGLEIICTVVTELKAAISFSSNATITLESMDDELPLMAIVLILANLRHPFAVSRLLRQSLSAESILDAAGFYTTLFATTVDILYSWDASESLWLVNAKKLLSAESVPTEPTKVPSDVSPPASANSSHLQFIPYVSAPAKETVREE